LAVISCAIAPGLPTERTTPDALSETRGALCASAVARRRERSTRLRFLVNGVPILVASSKMFASSASGAFVAPGRVSPGASVRRSRLEGLAETPALAMPLGFSMGEVVVTLGVVAVAFGPKDIPVIARGLGRMAGQAVGACASRASRSRDPPRCAFPLGVLPRCL
jgi:hypothetical protein